MDEVEQSMALGGALGETAASWLVGLPCLIVCLLLCVAKIFLLHNLTGLTLIDIVK